MAGLGEVRIVNPVVQDLVLGYFGPKDYIATKVMPVKKVPKLAATIPVLGKETRRHHDTRIVPKQAKKFIDYALGSRDITVDLRAGHAWVTDQEVKEWTAQMLDPEQMAAERALDDIFRDIEVITSQMVFNLASWTNNEAAGAVWANVAYDIPAEVDAHAVTVENAIGIDRSYMTLVTGANVWPWIRRNTAVRQAASIALGRRETVQAPIGLITPEIVAQCLGIKQLLVGREMIASDTTPVVFARCWDDDVALMYIPEDPNKPETMPFGYNCRRDGYPEPLEQWLDMTKEGNPLCTDVDDAISPNLFADNPGVINTSEAGYYWDNAI